MHRLIGLLALFGLPSIASAEAPPPETKPGPATDKPLALPPSHAPPTRPPPPSAPPQRSVVVVEPRPRVHYVERPAVVTPAPAPAPPDLLERADTWALGLRAGSLWSGYTDGAAYADMGLGLSVRYRPEAAVGLEAALEHHDQTFALGSERQQTLLSGSVELFGLPTSRVSPYALIGATYNARAISDDLADELVEEDDGLWGPHAGAGIEFGIGDRVALDLEARFVGYLNRDRRDASLPGAVTTTAGLVVHF